MKKLFTLLTAMVLMFALNANAQERKSWDFTKGVSDESRALLDADGTNWTKSANADGISTGWATKVNFNGELTANGQVLKEFATLQFGDFAATNAVNYLVTRLRLQKDCSFTINGLTAGQTIVMKAQSANATEVNRGFGFSNATIVEGPQDGICLGRDAAGAPEGGVTTFVLKVNADGAVTFSTGVNGAPKSGVEILSIIIDEGDKNIKKWDFSAFSAATAAQVCAAEDWTKSESASKNYITGDQIRWINTVNFDANNDLTAGGVAIEELKGLLHEGLAQYGMALAFDYQNLLDGNQDKGWGPFAGGSYLWVMTANSKITVPNVKLGSTFKLGVETHKLLPAGGSEARGFKVLVNGAEVGSTQTVTNYTDLEYTIPADATDEDGDGYVNVTLQATKGCHLYSIEAEVKDETIIDKNPRTGEPKYAPRNGEFVDGSTNIEITFPNARFIEPETPVIVEFTMQVNDEEPEEFVGEDALEGNIADGVKMAITDYMDLEPDMKISITIDKIIVGEEGGEFYEVKEPGDKLEYATAGLPITEERKWNFATSAETAALVAQSNANGEGLWGTSSNDRYTVTPTMNHGELYANKETKLDITDGLFFNLTTSGDMLIGSPSKSNYNRLQLGGSSPVVIIPQCAKGDEITINTCYASSGGNIIITNGLCDESNTITCPKAAANFKITVEADGDVYLKCKGTALFSISILPASTEKKEVNYTINAVDPDGNVLKSVQTGTGMSNDQVDVMYSYYLKDEAGNLYTKGTRGTPFTESFVLEAEKEQYNLEYSKKGIAGLIKTVFCSEAEELGGVVVDEAGNKGIRASNGKCAYPDDTDVTICTLEPGTYKIKALLWDQSKGGGVTTINFTVGGDIVTVISSADNMSDVDSDEFTVTAPTQIVWPAEGNAEHCLDAIIVYQYDAEVAADTVVADVNADVETIKVIENNQLVIKTAKGCFNVAGMQVK